MIQTLLDQEAERGADRYGRYADALRGIFQSALADAHFGTLSATQRAVNQAYELAETFLAAENDTIWRVTQEIAESAQKSTRAKLASIDAQNLTDAALEHLSSFSRYIQDELIAQIHRDVATLRSAIRGAALEVSLSQRARGISGQAALMEYRIGNQSGLKLMFRDRNGRQWTARRFVRTMWRQALLGVYNEIALMTIADHGLDRAVVRHMNGDKAEVDGMIVAIGSNTKYPTYSEIRLEVFHPNSNAVLEPETRHVQA